MKRREHPLQLGALHPQFGQQGGHELGLRREVRWLDSRAAAIYCGYADSSDGRKAFRMMVMRERVFFGRVGRALRFRTDHLDEWLVSHGSTVARRLA